MSPERGRAITLCRLAIRTAKPNNANGSNDDVPTHVVACDLLIAGQVERVAHAPYILKQKLVEGLPASDSKFMRLGMRSPVNTKLNSPGFPENKEISIVIDEPGKILPTIMPFYEGFRQAPIR
jgi:hypothetical protein